MKLGWLSFMALTDTYSLTIPFICPYTEPEQTSPIPRLDDQF